MNLRTLLSLVLFVLVAGCSSSSVKKAAVKQQTGVGKGPVEKAEDKAEKKVDNTKKSLDRNTPDLKRD